MKKVDVIINVFGKPWQTLCTLKSLLIQSGQHIDKIFLIKEKEQPSGESLDWVFEKFDNLIIFEPKEFAFLTFAVNHDDINQRYKVRYQYGIENSNKKHVFITHNDVLYTGDVIGEMLNLIGDSVGIGEIGQCHNCPANKVGVCSGEKFNDWNPTLNDIMKLPLPHVRTHANMIDMLNPKPLPECRLNEWACLVNREIIMKESKPNGSSFLFGQYGLDLGTPWFKDMYLKGYKFIDYRRNYTHSYWSSVGNGYQTQLNAELYSISESNAKKYYEENFQQ